MYKDTVKCFKQDLFFFFQALVFVVMRGPFEEDFYQCINSFPDPWHKRLYYIFSLLVQFLLPLVIMIIAYGLIFCTISRKSKEFGGMFHLYLLFSFKIWLVETFFVILKVDKYFVWRWIGMFVFDLLSDGLTFHYILKGCEDPVLSLSVHLKSRKQHS